MQQSNNNAKTLATEFMHKIWDTGQDIISKLPVYDDKNKKDTVIKVTDLSVLIGKKLYKDKYQDRDRLLIYQWLRPYVQVLDDGTPTSEFKVCKGNGGGIRRMFASSQVEITGKIKPIEELVGSTEENAA